MKIDPKVLGELVKRSEMTGLLAKGESEDMEFIRSLAGCKELLELVRRHAPLANTYVNTLAVLSTMFQLGFEVGAVWARPELEVVEEKAEGKAN